MGFVPLARRCHLCSLQSLQGLRKPVLCKSPLSRPSGATSVGLTTGWSSVRLSRATASNSGQGAPEAAPGAPGDFLTTGSPGFCMVKRGLELGLCRVHLAWLHYEAASYRWLVWWSFSRLELLRACILQGSCCCGPGALGRPEGGGAGSIRRQKTFSTTA